MPSPAHVVAVTGCGGFIGVRLTRRLLYLGANVLGVDNFTEVVYPASHRRHLIEEFANCPNFRFLEASIDQPVAHDFVRGAEVVINLAGLSGQGSSWDREAEYHYVNASSAAVLFETVARTGTRRFIQASTSSVYGDVVDGNEDQDLKPCSPYGESKLAGEQMLKELSRTSETDLVTARLFSVYGPGQRDDMGFARFVESALANRPLTVHNRPGLARDFTYVDDVVEAIIALIDRSVPAGEYNVASAEPIELLVALNILDELFERPLDRILLATPPGMQSSTRANIDRLLSVSKWRPSTSLRQGLLSQIEFQRERLSSVP